MNTAHVENDQKQVKQASNIALASLLNLTMLPFLAFIWLLMQQSKVEKNSFSHYHLQLAIKLNLIAAVALFIVSLSVIYFGGIDSPWTWVFVITYFISLHTAFIVTTVWLMIRSWSGKRAL